MDERNVDPSKHTHDHDSHKHVKELINQQQQNAILFPQHLDAYHFPIEVTLEQVADHRYETSTAVLAHLMQHLSKNCLV